MKAVSIRPKGLWSALEVSRLKGMFLDSSKTKEQIAQELSRTPKSVEKKLTRLGLKRYQSTTTQKYSQDFKHAVIEFYHATNGKETSEKFGITISAVEGILRRARNNKPILVGERKSDWKITEVLELLRYLGLKPTPYIATRLNKTNAGVESYIKRRGFRLHYINGLKQDVFFKNFKAPSSMPFMRNLEGEVFIPWVTMEDNINHNDVDQIQLYVITAMAKFQRFLHGCENNKDVIIELWNKMEE